ncbi:hypothetical protein LIER_10678 [Lithospermum erythrorhizon]|uniref:Retrotransposon gag domain-containing protein n=1 Tax=Lithospermum erythrorhizon TaxID=34254 RepID=A0AAV3PPI4_LITER
MLPEYGYTRIASYKPLVVHQRVPPADANAVLLQELLAAQKRKFDEFKQTFTQYRGTGDPPKHLKGFLAQITITTNNMDIYAKAFPNSLTGAALDWHMKLPANSIDSYACTSDAFIAKYTTSITNKQDKKALVDLQQRPRESLKDFHERY